MRTCSVWKCHVHASACSTCGNVRHVETSLPCAHVQHVETPDMWKRQTCGNVTSMRTCSTCGNDTSMRTRSTFLQDLIPFSHSGKHDFGGSCKIEQGAKKIIFLGTTNNRSFPGHLGSERLLDSTLLMT